MNDWLIDDDWLEHIHVSPVVGIMWFVMALEVQEVFGLFNVGNTNHLRWKQKYVNVFGPTVSQNCTTVHLKFIFFILIKRMDNFE